MPTYYLACDLGADSGRLMLGTLDQGKITVEELHRFPNGPVKVSGALHWDIDGLFDELKAGLKKAAARNLPIASISTDSWGVDYVLYDERGPIMQPVWCYRDSRTAVGVENVKAAVDWPTIYSETGIQFMALNTIYQLAAEPPERLARAKQLLLIGDAFNYFCSGVARNEVSLASTTQLYNPQTKTWSKKLFARAQSARGFVRADLPVRHAARPAEKKSRRRNRPAARSKSSPSCSHDTGAAVAAVPASGGNWAYLSSGTWSLMGVEWPQPVINDQGRALGFTNEIGFGDTVRLLKNIVGLWIVQAGAPPMEVAVTSRLRELIQQLGEAIHESVIESEQIAGVVQDIRKHGFDVLLMLEATIGLNEVTEKNAASGVDEVTGGEVGTFTPNDLHFLRSLRIAVEGEPDEDATDVK